MKYAINRTLRVLSGCLAVFLLAAMLAACDTTAPEADLDAPSTKRLGGLAPTFSVNASATRPHFDGLLHRATGNATLKVDPAAGHLVVSNIGSSSQDGFHTKLGNVHGVRRTFEPITLRDFEAVTWQLRGQRGNGSTWTVPMRVVANRIRDTVVYGLWADFSALGATIVAVQIWDDTDIVHTATVPASGLMATLGGQEGEEVVLETSRATFNTDVQAHFVFESSVVVSTPGFTGVGNEIRLVPQNVIPPGILDLDDQWVFKAASGGASKSTAHTDVVVKRVEVLADGFWHRGLGPAAMRVDASRANTTIAIRNLSQGEAAGLALTVDRETDTPAFEGDPHLSGVTLNTPRDVFTFEPQGEIPTRHTAKNAMAEPKLLGKAQLRQQGRDTEVCATFPSFVTQYQVQATREAAVVFEETVPAGACASLPAALQRIVAAWTDHSASDPFTLPDLRLVAKARGSGGPIQIRIRPLNNAPGEVLVTGWETTYTGNFISTTKPRNDG